MLLKEQNVLFDQRARANSRIGHLEAQLAQTRKKMRGAHNKANTPETHRDPWFVNPEDQLRYEILSTWVRRVPASEKVDRILPGYLIGPRLIESITRLHGVSRSKILEVIVDILTGHAVHLAARSVHPLRTGEGAEAGPVTRKDGAVCWRANLQVNTPSARRLHYWRLPNKSIELSRVVVHDDYNP